MLVKPSTLSQEVHNSALVFTSCLHRALRSARGMSLGPFQVFPEHVHKHGHGFLDKQEYVSTFQKSLPPNHLIPQVLWLVCFPQLLIHFLRQQLLMYLLLNVFDKCPLGNISVLEELRVRLRLKPFELVL